MITRPDWVNYPNWNLVQTTWCKLNTTNPQTRMRDVLLSVQMTSQYKIHPSKNTIACKNDTKHPMRKDENALANISDNDRAKARLLQAIWIGVRPPPVQCPFLRLRPILRAPSHPPSPRATYALSSAESSSIDRYPLRKIPPFYMRSSRFCGDRCEGVERFR